MNKLEELFIEMCSKLKPLQETGVIENIAEKLRQYFVDGRYFGGRGVKGIFWSFDGYILDRNKELFLFAECETFHQLYSGSKTIFLPTPTQCQELSGLNWVEFHYKINSLLMEYFDAVKDTTLRILALKRLADIKWGLEWKNKDWRKP